MGGQADGVSGQAGDGGGLVSTCSIWKLSTCPGTATSAQAYDFLIESGAAQQRDLVTIQRSGETRFAKETRFARRELVDAGLILNGTDGVWSLSAEGWRCQLSPEQARELVRLRRHHSGAGPKAKGPRQGSMPTTGPRPTSWMTMVTRDAAGTAWTYVMRFGTSDVWKIGHAENVQTRLAAINAHLPVEILGREWAPFLRFAWPNSDAAYLMEQELFRILKSVRTARERVRCDESEMMRAWREAALTLTRKGRSMGAWPSAS
jgi:hypothetical protein